MEQQWFSLIDKKPEWQGLYDVVLTDGRKGWMFWNERLQEFRVFQDESQAYLKEDNLQVSTWAEQIPEPVAYTGLTVGDLIAELQKLPADAHVMVYNHDDSCTEEVTSVMPGPKTDSRFPNPRHPNHFWLRDGEVIIQ